MIKLTRNPPTDPYNSKNALLQSSSPINKLLYFI
jgi:hypothetical protein